jgi:hypothetical protein
MTTTTSLVGKMIAEQDDHTGHHSLVTVSKSVAKPDSKRTQT